MSCSVHDSVELESRGIPTVAIHTEAFINSAVAHGLAFGRPDYQFAAVRHPIAGLAPDEVKERAEEVVDDIVDVLTGGKRE